MKIRVFHSGKGDCLLLTSSDGKHILVDGGHVSTGGRVDNYSANVARTLGRMRKDGEKLDLVCVSHIDQDHIGGILRMLNDEFEWRVFEYQTAEGLDVDEPKNPRPPPIDQIWHNSFHEQIGKNRRSIGEAIAAAAPRSLAVGLDPLVHGGNLFESLATSMKEAAELSRRIGTAQLGIPLNDAFGKRLVQARPGQQPTNIGSFRVTIIGPNGSQLRKLRRKWNAWLRSDSGKRQIHRVREQVRADEELLASGHLDRYLAAYIGPAVGRRSTVSEQNVASVVMFVEDGSKNILLTGDARDDEIVEQLIESGIADSDGFMHVNVLKVQHHGSENNFSKGFARRITADHYIFCGNGEHGNPDRRVVEQVIDSRLGVASVRSPNPQTSDRFKLWFNSDRNVDGGEPHVMEKLETLVRNRAAKSRGQMRFRFTSNRSFSFFP